MSLFDIVFLNFLIMPHTLIVLSKIKNKHFQLSVYAVKASVNHKGNLQVFFWFENQSIYFHFICFYILNQFSLQWLLYSYAVNILNCIFILYLKCFDKIFHTENINNLREVSCFMDRNTWHHKDVFWLQINLWIRSNWDNNPNRTVFKYNSIS